jgi:hypothetical protein
LYSKDFPEKNRAGIESHHELVYPSRFPATGEAFLK